MKDWAIYGDIKVSASCVVTAATEKRAMELARKGFKDVMIEGDFLSKNDKLNYKITKVEEIVHSKEK